MKHWPEVAVVNVKDFIRTRKKVTEVYPLTERWVCLLSEAGYARIDIEAVSTPGHRNGANRDVRVDDESIILAWR